MRLKCSDVRQWVKNEALGALVSPLGEEADKYKIIWDKETHSAAEVKSKYGSLTGYSGVATSGRGVGARFETDYANTARQAAGIPQGDLYQVATLPVDMGADDLRTIAKEGQWEVAVLDAS